jgi:hypothetical protein
MFGCLSYVLFLCLIVLSKYGYVLEHYIAYKFDVLHFSLLLHYYDEITRGLLELILFFILVSIADFMVFLYVQGAHL